MMETRREFLRKIGLGAGLLSLGGCVSVGTKISQSSPNILFIMSDDHASHAIGCYGSRINKTPHIDRLAEQGMTFRQMMVT
ncbi:MAG: sulfatase-like hydrolase/transferase, partial [Anaerohalosphaera sp.]|nr:sulfatase-like hydrolase/transferase [Anaerohalosphaera sp.]